MTTADYELIDRKIEGLLTSEEERNFAARLRQDPEFADAYRTQQLAIEALRTHHQQQLRQEVGQMYIRSKQKRQSRSIRSNYAAAAVVVVSLAGLLTYRYVAPSTAEQRYATYYTVYPARRVTRGADTTSYERGVQLYSEGRYAAALPYLEQPPADSLHERTYLLLGNSYLQTDQPVRAQEVLAAVAASDDAVLRQQGQWYLALSYLKEDNPTAARPWLEKLAAAGMYQKEAQELLAAY